MDDAVYPVLAHDQRTPRSEAPVLTRGNTDLENQTVFVPESKNGRPRKLSLRTDVIALLEQLPRNVET